MRDRGPETITPMLHSFYIHFTFILHKFRVQELVSETLTLGESLRGGGTAAGRNSNATQRNNKQICFRFLFRDARRTHVRCSGKFATVGERGARVTCAK